MAELKRSPNIPMTAKNSWRNLKILLGIKDLPQYHDFLVKCPDIDTAVIFKSSQFTKSRFDFGIYSNYWISSQAMDASTDDLHVINLDLDQALASPNQDIVGPVKTNTSVVLQADPVEATITGTPEQTNVSLLHETQLVDDDGDTDLSITTYGTNEGNITMPEISWGISDERTDDIVGFRKVHYHLFEVTTNWMQQSENKYHPFYLKWQKAIHSGLTALSEWDRVA